MYMPADKNHDGPAAKQKHAKPEEKIERLKKKTRNRKIYIFYIAVTYQDITSL